MQRKICKECDAGTMQADDGGNYCQICRVGEYTPSATECEKCSAGERTSRYTKAGGCVRCPKGSFNDIAGSPVCQLCPKGHYAAKDGSKSCTECPRSWFMPLKGQTRCAACDLDYYPCNSGKGSDRCHADEPSHESDCNEWFMVTDFNTQISEKDREDSE